MLSLPGLSTALHQHQQAKEDAIAMASKRLIKELDAFNRDPSPALSLLEPINDDDLFNLTAVLRGPEGTAYEGMSSLMETHKRVVEDYCTRPEREKES